MVSNVQFIDDDGFLLTFWFSVLSRKGETGRDSEVFCVFVYVVSLGFVSLFGFLGTGWEEVGKLFFRVVDAFQSPLFSGFFFEWHDDGDHSVVEILHCTDVGFVSEVELRADAWIDSPHH